MYDGENKRTRIKVYIKEKNTSKINKSRVDIWHMHNATIHDTLDKIYQHQYNPDAGTPSYHKSTD